MQFPIGSPRGAGSTRCVLRVAVALGAAATWLACAAEWKSLFNGRDLAGWKAVHEAVFEAGDGGVRLVRGMGWLRTEEEFGDFILEVDVRPRVERYDSGLFFRAGADGAPWPKEGWLVNLRRDKWGTLVRNSKDLARSEAEGPDVEDTTPFSHFRLEVRGSKATLDLDGKRLWAVDGIDRPRGHLGIQAEDRAFDFRNLRIQVLER